MTTGALTPSPGTTRHGEPEAERAPRSFLQGETKAAHPHADEDTSPLQAGGGFDGQLFLDQGCRVVPHSHLPEFLVAGTYQFV